MACWITFQYVTLMVYSDPQRRFEKRRYLKAAVHD
jgi:hypothetical protein